MLEEPLVIDPAFSTADPPLPQGGVDRRRTPEQPDENQHRRAKTVGKARAHRNGRKTRKMILLAEDSDAMRDVIAMRLRRAGYLVVECRDGSELVRALAEYLDEVPRELMFQEYDLLISDIRMPGISGLSVAEAARDCCEFPPTILITAFGDEETHRQALQSGVAAVFDKPFDLDDLLQKVREVLVKSPDDLLPDDE